MFQRAKGKASRQILPEEKDSPRLKMIKAKTLRFLVMRIIGKLRDT